MADETKETRNSLIYKVAERAKVLSDMKIEDLRAEAPSTQDTRRQAVDDRRYQKRGELVEEILTEEFLTDTDVEFKDDHD